jgi:hypothetical protein
VAELFEKKEIKQRYSFEVLCDFIFDKAKRLFSKYENAIKDNKSDKQGQNGVHKKVQELEQVNDNLRKILKQQSVQGNEAIKKLSKLLGD